MKLRIPKLRLVRRVGVFEPCPRGYRVAWFEPWHRNGGIAFPIGIHWLAMAARWLWERSYWCAASRLEQAYDQGFTDGREALQKQLENDLTVWANTSDAPKTPIEVDWISLGGDPENN